MDEDTKSLLDRLDQMEGKTELGNPFEEPEAMKPMVPYEEESEAVEPEPAGEPAPKEEDDIPPAYHALNASIQEMRREIQSSRQREAAPVQRPAAPVPPPNYDPNSYVTANDLVQTQQHVFQYLTAQEQQLRNMHLSSEERRAVEGFQRAAQKYPDFQKVLPNVDPRQVFQAWTKGDPSRSQSVDWGTEIEKHYKATKYDRLEKENERLTRELDGKKTSASATQKQNILKLPGNGQAAPPTASDKGYLRSNPKESFDAYSRRLAKHLGVG